MDWKELKVAQVFIIGQQLLETTQPKASLIEKLLVMLMNAKFKYQYILDDTK